jgi:hypothetical protein
LISALSPKSCKLWRAVTSFAEMMETCNLA